MKSLQQTDLAYHLSPMSDWKSLTKEGGRKIIVKGKGIYVWDDVGNRYIDGMSGLWCVNLGYSCEPIKKAIKEQLDILPYYNAFFKTSNEPAAELSEILAEVTPSGINHFFYGCSGSESNDTVYKLVRRYWNNTGQPWKRKFIARKNGYHGSTLLSATLGGIEAMHNLNDTPIPDIVHISQPYSFDAGVPYNDKDFGYKMAKEVEDKILELGPDQVAAFIGEPIQGAGGVIIPPDSYWPEVEKICRRYNVILVTDEVICGFGRTGKWFGCDLFGVKPDLMTMAKGITSGYVPLSAVGVSDRIYDGLLMKAKEFSHGYTYSSHPVLCQAGVATLKYIREKKLIDTISQKLAPYLHKQAKKLEKHPLVGEVRYQGLLIAIELVKNKKTRERFQSDIGTICRDICFQKGLIMRACKHTMVLAPPFITTIEEVDAIFKMIDDIMEKTLKAANELK